jgi:hypothetical protein
MRIITLSLILVFTSFTGKAQNLREMYPEFADNSNGLMYKDSTISVLRHMVDSLNLGFKKCGASPQYYSLPQGLVYKVRFTSKTNELISIRRDIEAGANFMELLRKYHWFASNVDTASTVIKYENYFLAGTASEGYDEDWELGSKKSSTKGKWTYNYSPKDKYQKANELECRYLPNELVQLAIPPEYADYIAYVDCMIDTAAVICEAGSEQGPHIELKNLPAVEALNKYLNLEMKLKKTEDREKEYLFEYVTTEKRDYALAHFKNDTVFARLVSQAADACIKNNTGSGTLEDMVGAIVSRQKELEMKRHRRVIGHCSQDPSPRMHARNIALLAAETNSWDIFLRAHMDIMNDRFERNSDGSYAYWMRKTYLKELEALHLDITDLIIGLSLRAANTAPHHYNGTVWRLGWALSESKDPSLVETKLLQMIKDERLDEFNRGLLYILYTSYLHKIRDLKMANDKIGALKKNANEFPLFLRTAIVQLKERTAKDDN